MDLILLMTFKMLEQQSCEAVKASFVHTLYKRKIVSTI